MNNNIVEDLELFNEIIKEFLNEEKTTPASKFISPENIMKEIDIKLDKHPLDNEKYKKLLKQLINSTPKSSSKHFFNQLYGGRHSKAVLGDLLAVILNTSMATFKIAGPQVIVEKTILETISNLVGYSNESGGTFPTGGSMSNFMSVVMARDKIDLSINKRGMSKTLIAYTSDCSHYSIAKNASFAGIGRENVRYILSNNRGQIDIISLEKEIKKDIDRGLTPFYLNATAGTTVLGAFDPVKKLVNICKRYKIWLHLDGAFGGSVIFSKNLKNLVEGIENVDSFCFNAHKTLGAPLSTSVLLVKKKKYLYKSFDNDAQYLYQTHDKDYNLGSSSFECGRRNNALKLWSMWKAIGTEGMSNIIERQFKLADFARKYVKNNKNYCLFSFENSLSICFNYQDIDPQDLCSKLYKNNVLLVGYGQFKNQKFIRLVIVNIQNNEEEILNFFKNVEDFVKRNKNLKRIKSCKEIL
tara:strand:- start:2210 stop:3616 length:1407 start_codon:yes stop_codon:yes gene_type:complete